MISRNCDFKEFLQHIEGLNKEKIKSKVEEERKQVKGMLLRFRTMKEVRNSDCQSYYDELHQFAFILNFFQKPEGMTKETALMVKPIIESLVSKGDLLPTALEMFEQWKTI